MSDAVYPRWACPACDRVLAVPSRPATGRVVLACPACAHAFPVPAELPPTDETAPRCTAHLGRAAEWICGDCGSPYCGACGDETRGQLPVVVKVSSCCGAARIPLARVEVLKPFWSDPRAVLMWPLRRAGLPMLVLFGAGSVVPFVGWLLLIALAVYLQQILRASARGSTHLPAYPEGDDVIEDVVYPLGRFLFVTAVAWLPFSLYLPWIGGLADPGAWLLGLLAVAIWPFAVTVASVARSMRPLLDLPALAAALDRIRRDYGAVLLACGALAAVVWLVETLAGERLVLEIVASVVRCYALFLAFHLLGSMVRATRHLVDWEI